MSVEQTPSVGILRIDPEIQRRIEEYARTEGVTPSELVRKAFEEYAAVHNGSHPVSEGEVVAFELLHRAGLIGCVKASLMHRTI